MAEGCVPRSKATPNDSTPFPSCGAGCWRLHPMGTPEGTKNEVRRRSSRSTPTQLCVDPHMNATWNALPPSPPPPPTSGMRFRTRVPMFTEVSTMVSDSVAVLLGVCEAVVVWGLVVVADGVGVGKSVGVAVPEKQDNQSRPSGIPQYKKESTDDKSTAAKEESLTRP